MWGWAAEGKWRDRFGACGRISGKQWWVLGWRQQRKRGKVADLERILQITIDVRVEKRAELENTAWFLVGATFREMTLEKGRAGNKCALGLSLEMLLPPQFF